MEESINELLKEQKKTNELLETILNTKKDPNELLTIEQVHKETKIGINMVRNMFNDPKLPVQRYTVPFKVTRKAIQEYISISHDYLREK